MNNTQLPFILTAPDVARILGMHKDQCRRLMQDGFIQSFYIGSVVKTTLDSVELFKQQLSAGLVNVPALNIKSIPQPRTLKQ